MKRGRRRDQYPQGDFRNVVLSELAGRGLSLRSLEILSGVNRDKVAQLADTAHSTICELLTDQNPAKQSRK
jgi:hypothetical protein